MIFDPLLLLNLGPVGRGTFPAFVQLDVFEFDQVYFDNPRLTVVTSRTSRRSRLIRSVRTTGKGFLT